MILSYPLIALQIWELPCVLKEALLASGRAINKYKVQRPDLSVHLLAVICSGKTKIIPSTVIDKIQTYHRLMTVHQLQVYVGLLGFWQMFVLHEPYCAPFIPDDLEECYMGLERCSRSCLSGLKEGSYTGH